MEKEKKFKITRKMIVLICLAIYVIISLILARGDYLEIKEIGEQYVNIFKTNTITKYIIMVVSFIVTYLIVYCSNKYMRKGISKFFEQDKKEMPKLPNKSISLIASLIVSLIVPIFLTESFLNFTKATQFGIDDPIFGLDISFFMFKLPFIKQLLILGIVMLAVLTIYTAVYYIMVLNIYLDGVDAEVLRKNSFIKQIIFNVVIIALLVAGLTVLTSQEVVTQDMLKLDNYENVTLVGAGITDVKIKIWGYRILGIVIILSLIRIIKYLKKFKVKKVVYSLLIVPGYLVILFAVMSGYEYLYAERNELDKQKEYIGYNMDFTKAAYGINVEQVEVSPDISLTGKDLEENSNLLKQIPIIYEDETLASLNEYMDNTGFYTYNTTRIGLYNINGQKQPVYITPREIVTEGSRTYQNKTYQYTHGYGVIASSINKVDELGNVEYIQSSYDMAENKIQITEPRIYYGLTTNDTVVVNASDNREFDYPKSATSYEENIYNGKGGLDCNIFDSLVIAINEGDLKLAISSDVTSESRILTNRNIRERAKKLMPYLIYDEEPYMVVRDNGRLVWVLDAYTVSNNYPYSQKTTITVDGVSKEINYIRNSVKVIIDAYDGTTEFYITDKSDPIVMMYWQTYPELFQDLDKAIPADIQKNIVYPKLLYKVQSQMLELYHDVSVEILYRGDDYWSVVTDKNADLNNNQAEEKEIEPYYTIINNDEKTDVQIGLIVPYSKVGKQSLTSYLVGTYNGENKLKLYNFSPETTLPGIEQLNVQINQDETISNTLNTLQKSGTRLIRKTYIVPINNSILYVEPVYQVMLNEDNNVPMLKKVIVATGSQVAIGDSLEEALVNLVSDSALIFEFIDTENSEQLIEAIIKANNNLEESIDAKDWELIGSDIENLQKLINQLEDLKAEENRKEAENDEENSISLFN